MDNQIINKAIGIVTQAIAADNNGDHKAAYDLYTRALEHFMLGLKCECPWPPLPHSCATTTTLSRRGRDRGSALPAPHGSRMSTVFVR